MHNIVIMAFTAKGYKLAEKISKVLDEEFYISIHKVSKLKEFVSSVFQQGNILVFIGAAGIAVRAISGLIEDKTTDPAVIVVDELGRYVIPILSGHIGGANLFAKKLSKIINASPVITTATDINNIFSVDSYAVQNRYSIVNPENIKNVSSALINRQEVGLHTSFEIQGALPADIVLRDIGDIGILISSEECDNYPFMKTLHLMPKCFHVGIGTRKNISFDTLHDYFLKILSSESIPLSCISSISSIDLKKNEEAIVKLAKVYGIKFLTYSAEQLKIYETQFEQSDFVKNIAGVGNVCEVSAYLSSNKGEIIVGKRVKNGITIAIAKEAWRVMFESSHDRS